MARVLASTWLRRHGRLTANSDVWHRQRRSSRLGVARDSKPSPVRALNGVQDSTSGEGKPDVDQLVEEAGQTRLARTIAMLKFMGPALILPLSDPLMSLIDAISLGRFAGTMQLAALGPTSVIFSFSSYVFNALGIATTSKVSALLGEDKAAEASRCAGAALVVALVAGIVSLMIMQVFAVQLIAATGAVSELLPSATAYLRVRAFAQPALLVSIVTQSCLLAQRDSKSPAHSVLLQVLVNSAGDVLLITQLGMGVVGAAWATVAAQYLGMLLLLNRLAKRGRVQFEFHSTLWARLKDLWKTLAPLVVVYVSRNLCYMRLQLAAAVLIPTQLAAHQTVWCLYTIASFATTTLEQAGLAFLPQSKTVEERRMNEGIIRVLGVAIGGVLGAICYALARFGVHLFSPDVLVHGPMKQIAPWCGVVMLIVGADVSAQALIIASGNSGFLARSFVLTLVLLYGFMSYASRWNLIGVWAGLVFFFGVRCVQSNIGAMRLGNASA